MKFLHFNKLTNTAVLLLATLLSHSSSSHATAIATLNSYMQADVTWNTTNDYYYLGYNPLDVSVTTSGSWFADGFAYGNANYSAYANWTTTDTTNTNNTETVSGKADLQLGATASWYGYARAWGDAQGTITISTPGNVTFDIMLSGSSDLQASTSNYGELAYAYLSLAQITIDGNVYNPPPPTYNELVYSYNGGGTYSYSVGGSQDIFLTLAAGTHIIHLDPVSPRLEAVPEPATLALLGLGLAGLGLSRRCKNA